MKTLQLTRTLYLALIAGLFLFTSCDEEGIFACENGEGTRVSEPRSVTGFDKIRLDLAGDVYVSQGSDFNLEITGQQNIIDQIKTEVVGSTLEISNDRCMTSYKTIRIDVTLPEVSFLEVDGSGDIYVLDLFEGSNLELYVKGSGSIAMQGYYQRVFQEVNGSGDISLNTQADEIETHIKGSGDVYMTGKVNLHNIDMDGAGNLESFELISDASDIRIAGSGDADIHVERELKVIIRGSGDVRYKGTPAVDADISGSGKLESVN